MISSRSLPPGTMIAGQWHIERMLGEGGFAVTYEAHNVKTKAHVALKEYMPAGCCNRDPGTSHVTAAAGKEGEVFRWGRERFMKEAETLARLDHPSIVRVTGYFEANGTAYMALGYEAGGTFNSWLKTLERPPTQSEIDRVLWPLLDALKEVHSLFLLHRDIKPDNILMRADGTPVLIDFGATRSAVAGHTQALGGVNPAATSAFAIVSHGYSPPEQYDPSGRMMGPASDIYALAATLHTALLGEPPPTSSSRHFNDPLRPLVEIARNRGLRPQFLAGIDQALSLNPKDRPQSAIEFRRALGLTETPQWDTPTVAAPARDSAVTARPMSFSEIPSAPRERVESPKSQTGLVLAAGLAALLLGGGGWWLWDRNRTATSPASSPANTQPATKLDPRLVEAETARRKAEQDAAEAREDARRLREAEERRIAIEKAKEETERQRIAVEQRQKEAAEAAKKKAEDEARRRDPVAALVPGSGQSARDRLADGSECLFCPEMVVAPAGNFVMGSPDNEVDRDNDEGPLRRIAIARPFAIGKFEVAFAEWDACVAEAACTHKPDDAKWGRGQRPVMRVSWDDITKQYLPWLSRKTGKSYRLLSEAEWEYAARAGTATRFSFGNDDARLGEHGWFNGNSDSRTQAVGQKKANPWGLYDMHGNVWEWTEDCWHANYQGAPTDGSAWVTACTEDHRSVRGGSWDYLPQSLRSAIRYGIQPGLRNDNIGFRVARTL